MTDTILDRKQEATATSLFTKAAEPAQGSGLINLVFPILSIATLGVVVIMSILGTTIVRQYNAMQMKSIAETGTVYVEGFLAPHVHHFFATGTFTDTAKDDLQKLMTRLPAKNHFDALKIWDLNGDLLFSTLDPASTEIHGDMHLDEMLRGEIVAELELPGSSESVNAPIPRPFIEIYSPIYDPTDETIVAIGEIYQDASDMLHDRRAVERTIWSSIGAATIGLVGMLLLVGSQRRRLARQLAALRKTAAENDALRAAADKARLEASQSNEQLLNLVGAELHDGPVQTLSLAMLFGDHPGQGSAPSRKDLVKKAMAELREISSGLVLPELNDLTLEETILLVVDRHENLTSTSVAASLDALPSDVSHPLKVCAYRVVQEGLNNAFRHAHGLGQQIEARKASGDVVIVVRDGGPGHTTPLDSRTDRAGLGLQGIRNRLEVFGGSLEVHFDQGGGTELRATLPISLGSDDVTAPGTSDRTVSADPSARLSASKARS